MKIISWFFGVGWVLAGIPIIIGDSVVGGAIVILGGLIVIPFTREKVNVWLNKKDDTLSINNKKAFGFAVICILINVIFFAPPLTPEELAAKAERAQIIAKEQAEKEQVNDENKSEWYIHNIKLSYGEMTGKKWVNYNSDQRLAISANVLAHFWKEKRLSPSIMNSINNMDDLKPYAKELTDGINEFYGDGGNSATSNETIASTAPILLTLMGWLS